MDQFNVLQQLGQLNSTEAGTVFRDFLRGAVRESLVSVMAEEVAELCGPKYKPNQDTEFVRAGSAPGAVLHEGQQERIERPRVRRKTSKDTMEEVNLKTYAAAKETGQLEEMLRQSLASGVSSREVKNVHPKSPKASKSSVSRLWKKQGAKLLDEPRTRDITSQKWIVLLLDGIWISKDQIAIVGVGITTDGDKVVLDFELGSSENYEVCKDLISRLISRGFKASDGLLALLDGSDALKKATLELFPHAVIQRCVIHKERNIKKKLARKEWGEITRLFSRLRNVEGTEAWQESHDDIEKFLEQKSATALNSFHEAGDLLLSVHRLNVPATLHKTLLSTNLIENPFRNVRGKIGRVTRFRDETDQASHWLAYGLLKAESGFRKVSGYRDLGKLAEALRKDLAKKLAKA
jgi:putative transposase